MGGGGGGVGGVGALTAVLVSPEIRVLVESDKEERGYGGLPERIKFESDSP